MRGERRRRSALWVWVLGSALVAVLFGASAGAAAPGKDESGHGSDDEAVHRDDGDDADEDDEAEPTFEPTPSPAASPAGEAERRPRRRKDGEGRQRGRETGGGRSVDPPDGSAFVAPPPAPAVTQPQTSTGAGPARDAPSILIPTDVPTPLPSDASPRSRAPDERTEAADEADGPTLGGLSRSTGLGMLAIAGFGLAATGLSALRKRARV